MTPFIEDLDMTKLEMENRLAVARSEGWGGLGGVDGVVKGGHTGILVGVEGFCMLTVVTDT